METLDTKLLVCTDLTKTPEQYLNITAKGHRVNSSQNEVLKLKEPYAKTSLGASGSQ